MPVEVTPTAAPVPAVPDPAARLLVSPGQKKTPPPSCNVLAGSLSSAPGQSGPWYGLRCRNDSACRGCGCGGEASGAKLGESRSLGAWAAGSTAGSVAGRFLRHDLLRAL